MLAYLLSVFCVLVSYFTPAEAQSQKVRFHGNPRGYLRPQSLNHTSTLHRNDEEAIVRAHKRLPLLPEYPIDTIERIDKEIRDRYHNDAVAAWEETRHLGRTDPLAMFRNRLNEQSQMLKSKDVLSNQSSDSVELVWDKHFAAADTNLDSSVATAGVTDRAGNVYVTGWTDSTVEFFDIMTIKYDPNGNVLWQKRYFGPDHNEDVPVAIALDSSGNVIVAGYTYGYTTEFDYLVIKYSSDGTQLWVERYDGPDHERDLPTCLGVDQLGNIYVGGISYSYSNFYDYATVKYAPDGTQLWVARYNGPLDFDDGINALTVDRSGDVIVTGMSNSVTGGADIATLKYAPDGTQQWVRRFDGANHLYDEGRAIASDDSGNIYVTGVTVDSGIYNLFITYRGEFVTVKYSPTGVQEWVNLYKGASDIDAEAKRIVVDPDGQGVYVAGWAVDNPHNTTQAHFTLLKYSGAGSSMWSSQESRGSFTEVLVRDASGGLVISGAASYYLNTFTAKYNPAGTELWSNLFTTGGDSYTRAWALAPDRQGNVFLVGQVSDTTPRYLTLKYSSNGSVLWKREYKGAGSCESPIWDFVVDQAGDIYELVGAPHRSITVKFSTDGAEIWRDETQHLSPGGIAMDSLGNVYIMGRVLPWVDNQNYGMLVKYNSLGNKIWSTTFGSGNFIDPAGLSVTPGGNAYVFWVSANAGTVARFRLDGSEEWEIDHPGIPQMIEGGKSFAIDKQGSACIALSLYDSTGWSVIAKYDSSGKLLWDRRHLGGYGGYLIATDDSNNVYGSSGYEIVKYDPNGNLIWTAPTFADIAWCVKPDNRGGVYEAVSGPYDPIGEEYKTVAGLVHFDALGEMDWKGDTTGPNRPVKNIALDPCGNVYATGWGLENLLEGTHNNVLTLKYTASGKECWRAVYNGFGEEEAAYCVALDGAGNVYVGGYSASGTFQFPFYSTSTLKYRQLAALTALVDSVSFGEAEAGCPNQDTLTVMSSLCMYPSLMSVSSTDSSFSITPLGDGPSTALEYLITFTPKAPGRRTGIITFNYAQMFNALSLPVSGTGVITRPEYTPNSVQFDTVMVGCSGAQSISVVNHECSPLDLLSITMDDPDFVIATDSHLVPGRSATQLHVTFGPLSVGLKSGHLIVSHNQGGSDTLTLSGVGAGTGSEVVVQDTLGTDWQLVSLPVRTPCPWVLPNSFAYDGGYRVADTLMPGYGYWNKRTTPGALFAGEAIAHDTVALNQNWNIVGSLSTPLATGAISSTPGGIIQSAFFGFSGTGYTFADTLRPAHGYWVKLSQAGSLIMGSGSKEAPTMERKGERFLASSSFLEFTDATQAKRRVYYTVDNAPSDVPQVYFALPPAFRDMLEVRFESNLLIESLTGGSPRVHKLLVSGATYPLTLRWDGKGEAPAILEIDKQSVPLNQPGSIVVPLPTTALGLTRAEGGMVPRSYGLEQNYPNPFNPSTTIRYQLPHRSKVRISVFSVIGQEIQTLRDDIEDAGYWSLVWNSTDERGLEAASGIYFIRMSAVSMTHMADTYTQTRKMLLLK